MIIPIKDYNPTQRKATITILLMVLNMGIFIYQGFVSSKPFDIHLAESAMVPKEITHLRNYKLPVVFQDRSGRRFVESYKRNIPPLFSLVTSMFMHVSWWHLLGNMLFLWIFGNNIEDYLGKFKFLIFYLLCGVGAGLTHVIFNWNSLVPVVGASGAVFGVMGAYLILYPKAQIRTLIFIFILVTFVDVPAYVLLIFWFLLQFVKGGSGGVAWLAHVGGFLLGMIILKWVFRKKSPLSVVQ